MNNHNSEDNAGQQKMPDWTAVVQALASVLTLVATIGGFLFVIHQIRLIERQMRGDTHGTIYEHYSKINERLSSDDSLEPYFSERQELVDGDPNSRQVLLVAEMFADFFEHVALQIENLPTESVDCWEKACYLRYSRSSAIQSYLEKYRAIYTPSIYKMLQRGEAKYKRDSE